MASLTEVHEAVFAAAHPLGPATDASTFEPLVGWVRVLRARVPAFDSLESGDLVLVPATALAVVAPGPSELTDLVAAFARARIAGIVVVGGAAGDAPGPAEAAGALASTAVEAGLPTFRLDEGDPGTLERSIIGFLVNQRAELERQAALLVGRLERLALGGADLPGLVAEIGGDFGRAVALEGRRGDPITVHAPLADPAAAAAVARYLAGSRTAALRVRLPGPGPGTSGAGTLALLGERPASDVERIAVEAIAGVLALQLARDEAVRRARDAARRGDAMPGAGPPWVVLLSRQVAPGTATALEQREATRRELRLLAPASRMSLRGDAESLELRLVLAASDDPGGLELGGRLATFLGRTVAISRPFSSAGDRPAAEAEARTTLEGAESLGALEPDLDRALVARADRLAAYQLLGGLHNIPDGVRHARALLGPLLDGRPSVVAERLATLRVVLDSSGVAEAAARLGVHRNTLAYRVRAIEARTGWRLSDQELRLPLAVAVRLVQMAQAK
jgi:hypothetical protein